MRALAIAATGMSAQERNLEVIANNVANINTTGFKRSRAEFTDLFYQMDRMQGVANVNGSSPIPEGANLGLGVKSAAIRNPPAARRVPARVAPLPALLQPGPGVQVLGPWLGGDGASQDHRRLLLSVLAAAEDRGEVVTDVLASSPVNGLLAAAGFRTAGECALMARGPTEAVDRRRLVALASLGSMG